MKSITVEQLAEWKRLAEAESQLDLIELEREIGSAGYGDNHFRNQSAQVLIAEVYRLDDLREAVPELVTEVVRLRAYLSAIAARSYEKRGEVFDAADFMNTTAENALAGREQLDVWPPKE